MAAGVESQEGAKFHTKHYFGKNVPIAKAVERAYNRGEFFNVSINSPTSPVRRRSPFRRQPDAIDSLEISTPTRVDAEMFDGFVKAIAEDSAMLAQREEIPEDRKHQGQLDDLISKQTAQISDTFKNKYPLLKATQDFITTPTSPQTVTVLTRHLFSSQSAYQKYQEGGSLHSDEEPPALPLKDAPVVSAIVRSLIKDPRAVTEGLLEHLARSDDPKIHTALVERIVTPFDPNATDEEFKAEIIVKKTWIDALYRAAVFHKSPLAEADFSEIMRGLLPKGKLYREVKNDPAKKARLHDFAANGFLPACMDQALLQPFLSKAAKTFFQYEPIAGIIEQVKTAPKDIDPKLWQEWISAIPTYQPVKTHLTAHTSQPTGAGNSHLTEAIQALINQELTDHNDKGAAEHISLLDLGSGDRANTKYIMGRIDQRESATFYTAAISYVMSTITNSELPPSVRGELAQRLLELGNKMAYDKTDKSKLPKSALIAQELSQLVDHPDVLKEFYPAQIARVDTYISEFDRPSRGPHVVKKLKEFRAALVTAIQKGEFGNPEAKTD